MKKKKILWLSRHEPLRCQIEFLKQAFGAVEIRRDINPFKSAEDIAERFKSGDYDDLVVVAPLSVIDRLTKLEIYPLWADMKQVERSDYHDLAYRGRYYKFAGIRRVKSVRMEFFEGI